MCASLLNDLDIKLFESSFKRDLLTLVDDRVITVRMTLARTLAISASQDKDVIQALKKLSLDSCGDIRDLVNVTLKSNESLISSTMLDTTNADSVTNGEEGMIVDAEIAEIDMQMDIMVEEEMQAAMQQFIET